MLRVGDHTKAARPVCHFTGPRVRYLPGEEVRVISGRRLTAVSVGPVELGLRAPSSGHGNNCGGSRDAWRAVLNSPSFIGTFHDRLPDRYEGILWRAAGVFSAAQQQSHVASVNKAHGSYHESSGIHAFAHVLREAPESERQP
jgi:hypothetical protein